MNGFNSPLGILLVEASPSLWPQSPIQSFNSPLGILLVEAVGTIRYRLASAPVSIPLSEFCWLKLQMRRDVDFLSPVSIPLSEFCWLKPVRCWIVPAN